MQNKNSNYDFDLIISSEDLKANRKKEILKSRKRKRKLRTWVKVVLLLIIGAFIGITIYQLFTIETVQTTPVGNYTCRGETIKVCTSSEAVADYLGV